MALKKTSVKESIQRSRILSAKIKEEILKYTIVSSQYNTGIVTKLKIPTEMKAISKKIDGCSLGADKNGFFVYTHRARSRSFSSPLKIDKKSIDYIETTG